MRLLERDVFHGALLLERCVPGTPLRERSEREQDEVIARLLRRLWRPAPDRTFRPLSDMLQYWAARACSQAGAPADSGLMHEGLRLFEQLAESAELQVLLATDLHAGNVLSARREEWQIIDPKPFVGDPAYDATQHLLNCGARLRRDPERTIGDFAGLLGLDVERIRLWTFARLAVESHPRGIWPDAENLARALLPAVAPPRGSRLLP